MPHVRPIAREALEKYEPHFQVAEQMMGGFVPNSLFTMAHRPEILEKFMMLAGTVIGPGTADPGLKQLVATLSTELEDVPRAFAERHLGASSWQVGKHR